MSLPIPTQFELEERQNSYEAGYISGWIEQQERVIKILEAEYEIGGWEMGIVPHFIALIKGEK